MDTTTGGLHQDTLVVEKLYLRPYCLCLLHLLLGLHQSLLHLLIFCQLPGDGSLLDLLLVLLLFDLEFRTAPLGRRLH